MITAARIHADSQEKDSVCHILQLGDYRADLGGWTRIDGAHTILAEVFPVAAMVRPDAELVANAESIAAGLASVQTDTIVHATYWLSKRIDRSIAAYEKMGGDDTPILKTMQDARISLMRSGTEQPLLSFGGARAPFRTKTLRIVMGLTILPRSDEVATMVDGMVDALRSSDKARKRAEGVRQSLAKRARDQWMTIVGKLSIIGCRVEPLDSDGAIAVNRELLYPRTGWKVKPDQDTWLPEYVRMPISQVTTDRKLGTVETDGVIMRCATLRGNPASTCPGSMSLPISALGYGTMLDFIDQGFVTINARARDKQATRFVLQQLLLNGEGGMGMPGRQEEALTQATRALSWIESDARKMFDVEMIAVIWDDTAAKAEDRIRTLADRFGDLSAPFLVEGHAGPSFIFRALPGGAQPPLLAAERDVMLCDRQIVDFLPVFYRSKGTAEAVSLFHGTGGEPLSFSLWGGNSQAFLVSGFTGQGKTFVCQSILYDILRYPNSQAIVIDKGDSFLSMTMSFRDKGVYKRLGSRGTRCTINILGGSYDRVAPFALTFLGMLLSRPGSPPLNEIQIGFLAKGIETIFHVRSTPTTYLRYEELSENNTGHFHIANAKKRLRASYVSESMTKLLATFSRGDSDINILYRYSVVSIRVKSGQREGQFDQLAITNSNQIPTELENTLRRGMGFTFDAETGDQGEVCILLHSSPDEADILRENGIIAAIDRTQCIVEVATEDDVNVCESAKIVFLIPPDALEAESKRIYEEIARDPGNSQATPDVIEGAVRRRMRDIGGIQAFRTTYGTATIQREPTLGDLGRYLEDLAIDEKEGIAGELANRLSPFYGTGTYSAFFDGHSNLQLSGAKITDIELGQLAEQVDEHIFGSIFTALIHFLNLYLLDPANRGKRKVLLIEEAWQYLKESRLNPAVTTVIGDALTSLLRTVRKHGVATGLVTQNVTDMTATKVGEELLKHIPIKILLRQAEGALDGAAEVLKLTPEEKAMLSAVKSVPGRYSQMILHAPEHSPRVFETAIFIPHPVQYWICTTRPEDVTFRESVIERIQLATAVSDIEAHQRAIIECAQRYPQGYTP